MESLDLFSFRMYSDPMTRMLSIYPLHQVEFGYPFVLGMSYVALVTSRDAHFP
jgi:hypothetical protein